MNLSYIYIKIFYRKKVKSMARFSTNDIIALMIAGLLAGILLPIGLTELVNVGNALVSVNGSDVAFSTVAPPVIITLIGLVVPIIMAVAVMKGFLGSK